ncbi:MAG: hypothetical protein ACI30V_03745 [Muribaculaceae bacterium]
MKENSSKVTTDTRHTDTKQPTANDVKQWMNAKAEPQHNASNGNMELEAFRASTPQQSGGYGKRVDELVKGLMRKTLL